MNYFHRFIFQQFQKNETVLHPLNYLFWECTWRCNLSCLHCGSDCKADATHPDMPFADFLQAIQPLTKKYKKDSITVVMTGGEPLLRKDLADCGLRLRQNGFRWGIVTNGYAYNQEIHHKLLAAGMGAVTLSIDGLEETHNRLRNNSNSFQKAIHALDLIVASNRLNYDVVTCVHPANLPELNELKMLLLKHKVKAWRLFTIAPIGRASHQTDLQLNGLQLKTMMEFIQRTRKENKIDIKFSCEAYTGSYEDKVRDGFFFCRAGINIASVLIDGSISACPNINRSFSQGSIYQDDFLSVWENRFQIMRDRDWMKTGICTDCKEFKHCRGGAMHLRDENKNGIIHCIYKSMQNENLI